MVDETNVGAKISSSSYIAGDVDPANFSYTKKIPRSSQLHLLIRNSKIQKATVWKAGEMIRERWEFKKEQPVIATKHGTDFTFETFNEWLEWIGFMQEVLKVLFWSLNFGDGILVFYNGNEKSSKKEITLDASGDYNSCRAYYPIIESNGYTIEDVDPLLNTPSLYKIKLQAHKAKNSITILAPASRVVRFSAPQKDLKYAGTSVVSTIRHDCIGQEQIKRAIVTQANNMGAGILAVKAANPDEKAIIDATIGDVLTHLRRVYYKNPEEFDKLFNFIMPDIKMDQIERLNAIIQTDIATGTDISKSVLEGAPQGALSSAAFDTFNTYSNIKQLQQHYKRAMEESFFKLGKMDTTFTWGDPTPTPPEGENKDLDTNDPNTNNTNTSNEKEGTNDKEENDEDEK